MNKAIHIYRTDGTYIKEERDTKPTLVEMQMIVGGYIQPLQVDHEGHRRTMIVNEEGKLRSLPLNLRATKIAGLTIVGDVLILEGWRL